MSEERRRPSPHPYRPTAALFTDFYEINMASVYFELGMFEPATFSLFCRRLPPGRPFIVFCGLAELLEALTTLAFTDAEIDYLSGLELYAPEFLDYLRKLSFDVSVRAMPEGSVAFAQEPLLEVTGPLPAAQIAETLVINKIQHASLAGSKAALCHLAAGGRTLVDFGARRAHGAESAAAASRAAYIAGFQATSNLEAAALYGIPPAGTMAHSFVQAFDDEAEAFRAFARYFGESTILLIDTFDTLAGARKAAEVAKELEAEGTRIRGVRIDSGDLVRDTSEVRRILDDSGCGWMQILVSGNLSEKKISAIVAAGAPTDAFGVGTDLSTSGDAPSLDIAYKLVRYAGRDVFKLSPKKATYPGPKQVFRAVGSTGEFSYDLVAPLGTDPVEGDSAEIRKGRGGAATAFRPLLEDVVVEGRIVADLELESARARFLADLQGLPEAVRSGERPYRVEIHSSLAAAIGGAEAL